MNVRTFDGVGVSDNHTGSGDFGVHLICCGYDAGIHHCPTWESADALRDSYIEHCGGHKRTAIIVGRTVKA